MKLKLLILMTGLLALWAAPAAADWNPGDPHKMHYPQLPDPNGWDVNFTAPLILADDWKCSLTGPVSDIHFWYSWPHDNIGQITSIHASIHADDRTDPLFSKPGGLLWQRDFSPTEFATILYGTGSQGWYDPSVQPPTVAPNDHFRIWQANITDIRDPFVQQQGTIYWLDLSVKTFDPTGQGVLIPIGWKTSGSPHFEDDAVWWNPILGANGQPIGWMELRDPITGQSLDMAFVITGIPEPGTMVMLIGLGLMGVVVYARRRR